MSKVKDSRRSKIKKRIRAKISGTPERPRLSVFRSNKCISVQLVDDTKSTTLAQASSKEVGSNTVNIELASKVGKLIAEKALDNGIKDVVFDRNGYLYHGKVKALAEAAREAGLKF